MNSSAGRTEVSGLKDLLGPLVEKENILAGSRFSPIPPFPKKQRQQNPSSGKVFLSLLLAVDKGKLFHIIYRLLGEGINNLLPEAFLISKNVLAHYR
jgi:hypothetical protein